MNTYNISFLSQDNSQLKLTVADGSKSRFTKMLTLKINFPENYIDSTMTDRPRNYKINSLNRNRKGTPKQKTTSQYFSSI